MHLPRLRRHEFWLATTAVWIVFFAVRQAFGLDQPGGLGVAWAAMALLSICVLAVARLNDRGRSGWWLAAVLVPVAGAVWLAWELALRGSVPHVGLLAS